MIVCVCKSVSDRKIRASFEKGADTFEELQFELGVATCCGKCEETVRGIMAEQGVCASRCGVEHPAAVPVPIMFYERKAA
ncbi:BFD-like [2Fe-2S] binding domain protein [Burkholderia thailandensis MSMB121]|uniref:(2Fe-2S)-binding protein n=1 Tax=Burkholderia humptydooensis TaxID=430531 RepID=UPI0003280403|nr:(2Fe-2S)-binding protein [Burkholderia humptydooensis]AGK50511.1 BFD-like [2Fe-2S] binding domain protein [Burkholderia thailandensis MSMB121]ATF32115.1 (2Fe-2S)-binding protein [Burkholderia thailandensis]KST72184.1 (2Fe-2S)-binding protein [Burkholderia humptydooensis]